MDRDKYMSGCELRQFLHISTRKMKYLMDHNYIPHENTGHATHKYLILREDAIAFKSRMDSEDSFLCELAGKFSSRKRPTEKVLLLNPTPRNCNAFRKFLVARWKKYPDALSAKMAADLIGISPPRINELVRAGTLHGVIIGNIQYIPKDELITYAASPAHIAQATADRYKQLLRQFNAMMCNRCSN